MGLIEQVFSLVFGSGRNVLRETAEVFVPNAEAQAQRDHGMQDAALQQFASEFHAPQRGWFDRLMDALNRVPRPAMALGTLGLFVAAMVDPVWFGARMAGLALVPEPLWWLLGAIVSFYFGARHQAKGQEFQRDLATRMTVPVSDVVRRIESLDHAPEPELPVRPDGNAALEEWQRLRRGP
ncbi:holin family protein [uncultured Marivita sp.]|uniref:holin family protein n=1 Tax=uncultured Marivita sp. TaxID=888080 RepID=UPI00262CFA82|nr:holin family protein [uncultured Marivita sp.]